jgi:methylenetetrahydrofolate dehydrogenase (NADP+)/methenyltetrahydrofolate cyclohydrolase
LSSEAAVSAHHAAEIIDGKAIAAAMRARVAEQVAEFASEHGRSPGLATILIGDDPASAIYVAMKIKACAEAGIESFHHALAANIPRFDVLALINSLNDDERVNGILCQLPVPGHLDAEELTNWIRTDKDVDGLTIGNAGRLALGMDGLRSCTPLGVMLLLKEIGVQLEGKHAVVIGRSNLFGKPMDRLLLEANATVTQCHRRTEKLAEICRGADILIAAVGQPEMVRGDWIKPGAVVIDVGINRTADGIVGDVCFSEALGVASAVTPVPGGVGPMTIACLVQNTFGTASAAAMPKPARSAGQYVS